ncbi:MAG: tRNA (adenosine(37)-N6)-dimethylallyltransferase MiaA [Pseudomonadota bacterium]
MTPIPRPQAILVAGPTASGKSALGVRAAARFGGAVINADSMQVYRDLNVLSARPDAKDRERAPHHLYGHVDGAEVYSTGRWLDDVLATLADVTAAGQLPVIVGGTGLYFKALLDGLASLPPIPPELRKRWREIAATTDASELHAMLQARDPESALGIRPSDRQRILRALEVKDATGRSILDWHRAGHRGGQDGLIDAAQTVRLRIMPDRAALYARCDARFLSMLEAGAVEEVSALLDRDLSPALPVMKAIGVREIAGMRDGTLSRDDAIARAQQETRRYAKRQMTWVRNQMSDWTPVDFRSDDDIDRILAQLIADHPTLADQR